MKTKFRPGFFIYGLLLVVVLVTLTWALTEKDSQQLETNLYREYYGASDQCVGYVRRYYQNVFDFEIDYVGVAQNIFQKADSLGLKAHSNGGTVPPQPGDILVFGHRNQVGHVAIITDITNQGVMIAEQNWEGYRISDNKKTALPLEVKEENGEATYRMPNRKSFKILGWARPTSFQEANTRANLARNSANGWIAFGDSSSVESKDSFSWGVRVKEKDPEIFSPIFYQPLNTQEIGSISIRARVADSQNQNALVWIRNEEDEWLEAIPASIAQETGGYKVYQANLNQLPETNFKQVKFRLSNPSKKGERWEIDWISLGEI
jgi:surface antigen